MLTSWHGNAFHVTGPLWGESTDQGGFLSQSTQLGRPLMFLWCKMQQTVEQRVKLAVMWDTSMLIWHHSIVSKLRCFLSQKMHLLNIDISYTLSFSYIISNNWFLNDFMWLSTFLCYILCYLTVHRTQSSAQKLCLIWWLLTHWPLGEMGVILNVSLSHPGIPGVTLCLYRFVRCRRRRRRHRLQILVYAITFEQLFGFLSFLAWLLALTCRLPD